MKDYTYCNVPIQLLRDQNIKDVAERIFAFVIGEIICERPQHLCAQICEKTLYDLGLPKKIDIHEYSRYCIMIFMENRYKIKVGIKTSILKYLYYSDVSEIDEVCCRAFLAIKTILGRGKAVKTNYNHIFARMYGFENYAELQPHIANFPLIAKYSARRRRNKIIKHIREKYNVVASTKLGQRGVVVSMDKAEENSNNIKITGNQTMGEARRTMNSRVFMEHECEVKKSTSRIPFGMYKGEPVDDIIEIAPAYVIWLDKTYAAFHLTHAQYLRCITLIEKHCEEKQNRYGVDVRRQITLGDEERGENEIDIFMFD